MMFLFPSLWTVLLKSIQPWCIDGYCCDIWPLTPAPAYRAIHQRNLWPHYKFFVLKIFSQPELAFIFPGTITVSGALDRHCRCYWMSADSLKSNQRGEMMWVRRTYHMSSIAWWNYHKLAVLTDHHWLRKWCLLQLAGLILSSSLCICSQLVCSLSISTWHQNQTQAAPHQNSSSALRIGVLQWAS